MDETRKEMHDQPRRYRQNQRYVFMKRIADIIISLTGLVVLSPLLAATAAAVKIYDGGNVLYSQVRLTQGGKRFRIYKFRSMVPNAEELEGATAEVLERILAFCREEIQFYRKILGLSN